MLYIDTPYGRGGWDASYYTHNTGLALRLRPAYYKEKPTTRSC